MQEIKELFLLLQPHHTPALLQPLGIAHAGTPWEQLVRGIQDGKYSSDADVLLDIYPGSSYGMKEWRVLKTSLRETLIQLVIRLNRELEQETDPEKVYAECHQCWLRVRLLSGENARRLAMDLAHQLLQIAEKFDLNFLCLDITAFLRVQLCQGLQTVAQCQEVNARHQHFRELYELEFRAEGWYATLIKRLVNARGKQPSTARLARQYAQQLKPAMKCFASGKLHLYGHLIQILEHLAEQDYQKVVPVAQKAVRFFQQRPYRALVPLQIFYYQQLVAAIQLKAFARGQKAAQQCMALTEYGGHNWYKFNELYVMLAFHTQHFARAIHHLTSITSQAEFKYLPASQMGIWTLFEAFAIVAHLAGRPVLPTAQTSRCTGVLRRLEDALEAGCPLPASAVLTVSFLIHLQLGQFDALQTESSRIERWMAEQQESEKKRRSYLFLDLLRGIPASGFHQETNRKRAVAVLAKLKKRPCQVANQTDELEVIPYEILWEMALKAL